MRYQKEEEEYDKEEDAGNCEEMVHVHLLEVAAFSVDIGTLRFVQNAHARAFLGFVEVSYGSNGSCLNAM